MASSIMPEKPNIVFILADDLGYADLGCYGRVDYTTPVLDSLAKRGVRLTQGYANSAVCSATRVAVLTGQYQYRYHAGLHEPLVGGGPIDKNQKPQGVNLDAGGIPRFEFIPLPTDTPTLPKVLKERGYKTHLVGKWHLGKLPDNGPKSYGYDTFFGFLGGAADYFTHTMYRDKDLPGDGLVDGDQFVSREGYLTDILGDEAVKVVESSGGDPFFLSLHFNAPHWPWEGPNDKAVSEKLDHLLAADGNIRVYGEMVHSMDENIGKLIDALEKANKLENTVIVFTSDNGGERFSDTWPFIGVKSELFEGGLRVPLIISWPKGLPENTVSDQVAVTMDFLPTFVGIADNTFDEINLNGYKPDGYNLFGPLSGKQPIVERRLFWRFKASEQAAIRDGDWKFLRIAGKEYLFNISEDERERTDHKTRKPSKLVELKGLYREWESKMLPYPKNILSIFPNFAYDRYELGYKG